MATETAMPHSAFYVLEKLTQAIYALATGAGGVHERSTAWWPHLALFTTQEGSYSDERHPPPRRKFQEE
jgi:hypothetical protein